MSQINEHMSARNEMAAKWAHANSAFMGDERLSLAARFVSEQIASEGIQADAALHFAELTHRLQVVFPHMKLNGIN